MFKKRMFDIVVSLIGIIISLPVLVVVTLLVLIFLGRPVFFVQERPGLGGKPFKLVKFRSMRELNETEKMSCDATRLTRFGKLLRSTSLDELPELFNVLRGEMSLVGPRPLLMEYLPLYDERQRQRHNVRPGITGLAQISGRNSLSWEKRFELDVFYVENHNLLLDMEILIKSIMKVVKREGISSKGHVTTEKFEGNKNG